MGFKVLLFAGIIVGFCIIAILNGILLVFLPCFDSEYELEIRINSTIKYAQESENKQLVLVGVMTTKEFLNTRAKAIYNTWAKEVPGKLLFFTSEESEIVPGLPMVRLPGIDDHYPPQNKSLAMIKYMHDHHLHDFHFFMRIDDDLHLRNDLLVPFLTSLSNKVPRYIGQPGIGIKKEKGKLGLGKNERFCMGGSGIILNQLVLSRIVPHLDQCKNNFLTLHEDVELWRCVRTYAKTSCTKNVKWSDAFYHFADFEKKFEKGIKYKDILDIITVHPLKTHPLQYKLYIDLQSFRIQKKEKQILEAMQEIEKHDLKKRNFIDNPQEGEFFKDIDSLGNRKWFSLLNGTTNYGPFYGVVKSQGFSTFALLLDLAGIISGTINGLPGRRAALLYFRNLPGKFGEFYLDLKYYGASKRDPRTHYWSRKLLSSNSVHVFFKYGLLWTHEVSDIDAIKQSRKTYLNGHLRQKSRPN